MLLKRRKISWIQSLYLREVIQGLLITLKNFLFGKKVSLQYPEERRTYSSRYRGMHYLKTTNGIENCTACMLCPTVCPAECIHIEAAEGPEKEKYPIKFEIDVLRCCFCGMCEEACPKDAIKLSQIYEMTTDHHEVYDKDFLKVQRGHKGDFHSC